MIDFRMPSLGADMEKGTVVEWLKKPGDRVARGDVVAVVETQKGARTIALDSSTHRIYLPTASFAAPAAPTAEQPRPRPTMIPDSFVILVLAPTASS